MDGSHTGNASRGCRRGWIHQAVHISLQGPQMAAALQAAQRYEWRDVAAFQKTGRPGRCIRPTASAPPWSAMQFGS